MNEKKPFPFGKRVRLIRGKRTREDLSEMTGLSAGYIGEIERGEKWPTFHVLMLLAEKLKVSPEEFFRFEAEVDNPQLLRKKVNDLLANQETEQLQKALRVLKEVFYS
jgi:transcriptional regulator with XRE-family HTH domain